jgi:hypothetical protein
MTLLCRYFLNIEGQEKLRLEYPEGRLLEDEAFDLIMPSPCT